MFKDRVVVVTGGANGIGRCIADEFRSEGAVVYVIDKQQGEHFVGEDNRYDGKEGVIEDIDAIGQLHGTWGGLAVIPEADDFRVIG